jgi:preprotein translocase subunit SecA
VHATERPILVGTTSIEKSERLSAMLGRRGVEHAVLNAKHHEREAQIVAEAGQPGKVTIATNMAGRGTDILLGPGVAARGGLHVIGTERHESRRIDNQLRGRSGRQGDPGSGQFYLSLQDDLMRIFAGDWVGSFLGKLGMQEGEAIVHPMVTRAITRAQKKVEARNFETRKNLLEYDEVMDTQRKEVYGLRRALLESEHEHQKAIIADFIAAVVELHVAEHFARDAAPEDRDPEALAKWFRRHFGVDAEGKELDPGEPAAAARLLTERAVEAWKRREQEEGPEAMRFIERFLLLNAIDKSWKDHLHAMDALKTGIGLRGYAQVDPKVEYKVEGHRMFSQMLRAIREEVTDLLLKVRVSRQEEQRLAERWDQQTPVGGEAGPATTQSFGATAPPVPPAGPAPMPGRDGRPIGSTGPRQPIKRDVPKVGRNDACPCGSGKKYKKCHGATEG